MRTHLVIDDGHLCFTFKNSPVSGFMPLFSEMEVDET